MTDFYTSIAPWYDRIFPADPETADFLAAGLAPGARCLDLACGTGGHAKALAARGFAVEACDLDPAMVGLALASPAAGASFRTLDMREAPRAFAGRAFDLIFCVGNSLVHLPDGAAVAALLAGLAPLLSPGGVLVLQVVNYDRVLDAGVRSLPTIRRPGLEFVRDYRLEGGLVRFATALTVDDADGRRVIRNEVPLLPLRREALEATLRAAGFRETAWSGEFGDEPWTPDSVYTVTRARIGAGA